MSDQNQVLENYEALLERGRRLAETSYKPWLEDLADDWTVQAQCGVMMENLHRYYYARFGVDLLTEGLKSLQETTLTGSIANFTRHAFPLVRAALPALAAQSLVSVQPMPGPTAQIFYFDPVYGTTKGGSTKGKKVFENPDRFYSSETVNGEGAGTGDGSATAFIGTLNFTPVKASTVTFTEAGGDTLADDGAGALAGDGTGTIDYATGQYTLAWTTAPGNTDAITVVYDYNMEGNPRVPQIDLLLTSATVTADERKVKYNLAAEAAFNLLNQHGLSAESELTAAITNNFKWEIDQEILATITASALNNTSGSLIAQWAYTVPAGTPLIDHYAGFFATLVAEDNYLLKTNGRARARWIVASTEVTAIIKVMPQFDGGGVNPPDARGVSYIGTLDKFQVYEDTQMTASEYIVGCKPDGILNQGFVYAPYIPLFTTPNVMLDDFISRQGFMSQDALKLIHANYYLRSKIKA